MIVSAHQPAYLPWLGYFHKIMLADVFVIMDDVQFEKNSFANRNKIVMDGRELMLTVPVRIKGHTTNTIGTTEVAELSWRKKHLKSIAQAYRKAPYFDSIYELVASTLDKEFQYLIEYCDDLTSKFLHYIKIATPIIKASSLSLSCDKLEYVIELTRKCGGDLFVFGALGKDYADGVYLRQQGITPYFQEYRHPEYHQLSKKFIPYVSILDIMFNEPQERIAEIILSRNERREDILANVVP